MQIQQNILLGMWVVINAAVSVEEGREIFMIRFTE